VSTVVAELRQVRLALADVPAALDELIDERLDVLRVVSVEAGVRTVRSRLRTDVVAALPRELLRLAGCLILLLRLGLLIRLPLPCEAVLLRLGPGVLTGHAVVGDTDLALILPRRR